MRVEIEEILDAVRAAQTGSGTVEQVETAIAEFGEMKASHLENIFANVSNPHHQNTIENLTNSFHSHALGFAQSLNLHRAELRSSPTLLRAGEASLKSSAERLLLAIEG